MQEKINLMNELINLYQQRKFVYLECTRMIVDEYIKKLELQLKELL